MNDEIIYLQRLVTASTVEFNRATIDVFQAVNAQATEAELQPLAPSSSNARPQCFAVIARSLAWRSSVHFRLLREPIAKLDNIKTKRVVAHNTTDSHEYLLSGRMSLSQLGVELEVPTSPHRYRVTCPRGSGDSSRNRT